MVVYLKLTFFVKNHILKSKKMGRFYKFKEIAMLNTFRRRSDAAVRFISDIFKVADPNIPNIYKTFFERPLVSRVCDDLMT
jgi:hypothetical protein